MGRYNPLRDHLAGLTGRSAARLSFADVEALVGPLPASARRHRTWWSNDSKVEAASWRDAGWHVERVDLTQEWVEFAPGTRGGSRLGRNTAATKAPTARPPIDHEVWEGDVQQELVNHLTNRGWTVLRQADTASKAQGIDVVAEHEGRTTAFEVKGFPGRGYRDPARSGERKPTNPSTQARHWFAGAVLTALLTKDDHDDWSSVICLPDAPTYRTLTRRTAGRLRDAGVVIWFVTDGDIVESG